MALKRLKEPKYGTYKICGIIYEVITPPLTYPWLTRFSACARTCARLIIIMADDCPKEQKSETPALVSQKRVFVRNLPLSTNEQDLKNVFTEIGPILNASVVHDKGELLKFLSTCTWNNLSSGYNEL